MTDFAAAMRKAANLTRSYNLLEATRVIQEALAGRPSKAQNAQTPRLPLTLPNPAYRLEGERDAHPAGKRIPEVLDVAPQVAKSPTSSQTALHRRGLGETVRLLRERRLGTYPLLLRRTEKRPKVDVPLGAQYLARSFSCAAGARNYKLYIPANNGSRPLGLILMLHGCRQNADDFAVGTAMNALADEHGLLVAYPEQGSANNSSSCWNWFRTVDQMRGQGEPAILAGITSELALEFNVSRERTFVAGLSAGGAMAMVMAETYPDLFAAAGVHSGLDYGSARDLASALAAMQGAHSLPAAPPSRKQSVRTIIFHGEADQTVHPSNAERIVRRLVSAHPGQAAKTDRGIGYTRCTFGAEKGPLIETWSIGNLGHAWSGGNAGGSFTEQHGPDASAEMVRFFLNSDDQRAS